MGQFFFSKSNFFNLVFLVFRVYLATNTVSQGSSDVLYNKCDAKNLKPGSEGMSDHFEVVHGSEMYEFSISVFWFLSCSTRRS